MTAAHLAETVEKIGETAQRIAEERSDDRRATDEPEVGVWIATKMLAEIAYQLAVANEREAARTPPDEPGVAYFDFGDGPVRTTL